MLLLPQVSAVLAYSHENVVDPFLEPVLGLSQALLEKDQQDMHRNMDGTPASPTACLRHLDMVLMLSKANRAAA